MALACAFSIRARTPFKPYLTQACRFFAAVAILAVGASGLRAVDTRIPDITFTTSSHAVAAAVATTAVWALLLLAPNSHEARRTVAHTIDTSAVVGAVTRAALERAVKPSPSNLAHAVRSDAIAMVGAVVGAWPTAAVEGSEASLTKALAVVAKTGSRAVVEASLERAVVAHPAFITRARKILAASMPRAVVRTDDPLRAVGPTPALYAVTRAVVA